jgi:hypothetical protein
MCFGCHSLFGWCIHASSKINKYIEPERQLAFWLGCAIWWEHPGAELGCCFASLAVVFTWGPRPASGVVGGGPWSRGGAPGGPALTFAPGRAAGAVFFQGGSLGDKWLDRTGGVRKI